MSSQSSQPMINLGEFLLVLPLLVVLDIIQILMTIADAAYGIGEVIKFVFALLTTLPMGFLFQLYLFFKGIRGAWYAVTFFTDMIPVVNVLPMMTLAWVALFILERVPAGQQALSAASKVTSLKGGGKH